MVTNLNQCRMAGQKNPTCCKCPSACAICCCYALNGKYLCRVLGVTLLCPFWVCFHENHNYISASFRAGQTCPGWRELQEQAGGSPFMWPLLLSGQQTGHSRFCTSRLELHAPHQHTRTSQQTPSLSSLPKWCSGTSCTWKTSSSRPQFEIH